ncbi:MAG: phospholipase D family protein [Nitrosopumilus sp.]|nr:phospholipase D family protein [Nitrosopumilus sp.]
MTKADVLATGEISLKHGFQGTGPAIEELIIEADTEIHILAYMMTSHARQILKLLEDSLERGVAVTIVLNKLHEQSPDIRMKLDKMSEVYRRLHVADFSMPEGDMHAKVIVADRSCAVIGSANFTFGGMTRNYEIGVRIEGKEAGRLSALIDSLASG